MSSVFLNKSVPVALKEQFHYERSWGYKVILIGAMTRIWSRPRWIRPVFKLLHRLGILVSLFEENIPVVFEIIPGQLPSGQIYHRWQRTFKFDRPQRFTTIVIYDKKIDKVVDLVGPGFRLHMSWDADFNEQTKTILLPTASYGIRLFRHVFWLPRWIWRWFLGYEEFEQRAIDDETVEINLRVSHPFFGPIIGYSGQFKVKKIKI